MRRRLVRLLVHVLTKGVSGAREPSRTSTRSEDETPQRVLEGAADVIGAGEVAPPDAKLDVLNATHSRGSAFCHRLLIWPGLHPKSFNRRCGPGLERDVRGGTGSVNSNAVPGLVRWLRYLPGGTLVARKWPAPPAWLRVPITTRSPSCDRSELYIGGSRSRRTALDDKGDITARREGTPGTMCR